MSDWVVVTSGLTKEFGRTVAVDHLDLKIPKGMIFGVVGPNGAGKTTLFGLLCGFIRPTYGDATVLDTPINKISSLGGRLSALPQDSGFPKDLKLKDILIHLARLSGMDKTQAKEEAKRVLDAVELLDKANLKVRHLSHGMLKRVQIAQAFLGSPHLVFLDEPTAGLDPVLTYQIHHLIRQLATQNTTVVISTHNLAEIEDLCEEVAILDRGRLVHAGPISQLVRSNEVLVLSIGEGSPDPGSILLEHPSVTDVSFEEDKWKVVFKPGDNVDFTISSILKDLVNQGVIVTQVERGVGLEERFMEVTKKGTRKQ